MKSSRLILSLTLMFFAVQAFAQSDAQKSFDKLKTVRSMGRQSHDQHESRRAFGKYADACRPSHDVAWKCAHA